jgi:1-deoxy-D-xylulose-5-phosphate reductoisomerase
MGAKNTIDSATMANKGLELSEAAYLFTQLGVPDMRVAVGYGLSGPDRLTTGVEKVSLGALRILQFEDVDVERFPALALARFAVEITQSGPLVFNAANEVAVVASLNGEIGLMAIPALIERCLERGTGRFCGVLKEIPEINVEAQLFCRSELTRRHPALVYDRDSEIQQKRVFLYASRRYGRILLLSKGIAARRRRYYAETVSF